MVVESGSLSRLASIAYKLWEKRGQFVFRLYPRQFMGCPSETEPAYFSGASVKMIPKCSKNLFFFSLI